LYLLDFTRLWLHVARQKAKNTFKHYGAHIQFKATSYLKRTVMANESESQADYFQLRILRPEDVSDSYVNWYQNKEVTRYSDNQYRVFSFSGQKEYVKSCLTSKDIDLYGIFVDELHIGNIAISGLHSVHKRAEITYVIGEREYWGRGAASFAICSLVEKARTIYDLNKLYAGLSSENIGSKRVLEKNGFVLEGVRKRHLCYSNTFYDQLDYGLLL
jgi:RimJ/RimL family protein N-acetyltransferase